jgi:glycerol-3-phosphate dehydrogenase (NAD(P)+)
VEKVCVLGAGSWGTALALLLHNNGYTVCLWGRPEDGLENIITDGENKRFLPGVAVPRSIAITSNLNDALQSANLVVMAVPSQAVREVAQNIKDHLEKDSYLVNVAKGLEISTGLRMSQVVEDVLGKDIRTRYAVLSGPSHAEEVARKLPTAVTVASTCKETAFFVQDIFMASYFRVYTNPDVAGVELGGALKNIIALGTGIAHGLGYGDNTTAALLTRGLTEIVRMGEALGGRKLTFAGLSGIGDLVVTCGSKLSRNFQAGLLIGRGYTLEEAMEQIGMVVEGAHTTRVVYKLAREMKIDMPITNACYNVLYCHRPPRDEVNVLMQRRKKNEIEEIVQDMKEW